VRETVAQFGRVRSDSIGPIYRPAKIKPAQFTSQSAVLRLHHVNCCAIQSDLRHPARAESEKEGDATTVVTGGAAQADDESVSRRCPRIGRYITTTTTSTVRVTLLPKVGVIEPEQCIMLRW
jgi:hypothetical protein